MARSEREKMLAGELYVASDPELVAARVRARRLWKRFNGSDPGDQALLRGLLKELLGGLGARSWIEPPFFDYGANIVLGESVFVNFGAVFLDPASIHIGDEAQIGPAVQLLTADHPREAEARVSGPELARPIRVGSRAWLSGGVSCAPA